MVHDMRHSLRVSAKHADAPWWDEVYREAFPTFQGSVNVRDNGSGQRDGIDRHIILANGRTITVDEKVRKRNYPDIFLEFWSVKHKNPDLAAGDERGWVAKDLRCDYIAYAFVPSQRCYLLPFPALRRAWRTHRLAWGKDYVRVADNDHYWTVGAAVPIPVLMEALTDAMLVHWSGSE